MENRRYSNRNNSNEKRASFSKKKDFTDNPYKKEYNNSQSSSRNKSYSNSGSYEKNKPQREQREQGETRFQPKNRFENSQSRSYSKSGSYERNSSQGEQNNTRFQSNNRFENSDRPRNNAKSFNPNFREQNQERGTFRKSSSNQNFKKDDFRKPFARKKYDDYSEKQKENESSEIRLNKFIADAGICSRRNADMYISSGNVEVNGVVMTTLGYRVQPTDVVKFDGKLISSEKKEYILLNKPKGFITTTSDEKGRKTVMDLVANATNARILPVGRLDRPTTGLLLLTNDGDLAKKLTHPTHGVRKIYHVVLDKKLDYKDFVKIEEGIELEDGFIQVDEISYVNDKPKNEIGVRIHSGRNRIVRRIFEHLGYNIEKLDRVVFAGLTKKDLPRGHWRRLTQQEIINLKNIK